MNGSLHEGAAAHFFTVLGGEVEVVKRYGGETSQLTTFAPGEYFGEIPLLLGAEAYVGVRALTQARLMRMDPADFHLMLTASSEASAEIARTVVRRMNFRHDSYVAATVTEAAIVGDRYDLACHDIRDFLARNQIAYEWLDPSDPGDAGLMPPAARDARTIPVVILANGRRLDVPTRRELAEGLNLQTMPGHTEVRRRDHRWRTGRARGGGLRRFGRTTHDMIEREAPGGQAGTSSRIENYLGFPGRHLRRRSRQPRLAASETIRHRDPGDAQRQCRSTSTPAGHTIDARRRRPY